MSKMIYMNYSIFGIIWNVVNGSIFHFTEVFPLILRCIMMCALEEIF